MEKQPVFKKSVFGGFDKNSVYSYVFELNNAAQEAQDKLNAQLQEVSAAREKLGDTIKEMESRMQGMQTELEGERAHSDELNSLIESLNAEIRQQQDIVAQKDEEIAQHIRRYQELEEKNRELEGKREEVERASAYIGELLLRTRSDSERILAEAGRKAEDMVAEAGRSLEDVHTQFERFQSEMAGVQRQIRLSMSAVSEKFGDITATVDRAESKLRDFCYPQRAAELKLVTDSTESDAELPHEDTLFFRPAADH